MKKLGYKPPKKSKRPDKPTPKPPEKTWGGGYGKDSFRIECWYQ